MSLHNYEHYKKISKILIIAGIGMLFETIKYSVIVGIIMIISGFIINYYYYNYYYNQMIYEKQKEFILKYTKENKNDIINNKIEPVKKEIKIINTFGKKYYIVAMQQIDPKGINNIVAMQYYYDINYDKISLFLDLYMFVKKYEIIINISNNSNNIVAMQQYYYYYHNIISYISNLDNVTDISIAMSYMMDDYNDNAKNLYKLIKELYPDSNMTQKVNIINIKSILIIFNDIITSQ